MAMWITTKAQLFAVIEVILCQCFAHKVMLLSSIKESSLGMSAFSAKSCMSDTRVSQ